MDQELVQPSETSELARRIRQIMELDKRRSEEFRAHLDRQFFELRFHIYIAYELLRRRIERLERKAEVSNYAYLHDYHLN